MSRYHVVNPANQKGDNEGYLPFNTVDFELSFEQRSLVNNTVRLLFDINWENQPNLTQTVMYDPFVGAHAFIDRIDISCANMGVIESISDYPRFVSAKAKASLTVEDVAFNSMYVCEGRTASTDLANKMLKGSCDIGAAAGAFNPVLTKPLDASVKLDCALNNMVGVQSLPYVKSGLVRLSVQLSKTTEALFGNGDLNYKLQNMRVMYMSVPDDGKYAPSYQMRVKTCLPQSILSSYTNISTKAPIVADAMFATFIQQSHLDTATNNSLQNELLPLVEEIEFIWADSMSAEFTYKLDNQTDILENYIKAVNKVVSSNSCSLNRLASNDSYGIGLSFNQFIDLSKTKLGVNIKSGVSSGAPFTAYLFFTGLVSL
jgi:hypothetical protein